MLRSFSSKKGKPWKDISSELHKSRCIFVRRMTYPVVRASELELGGSWVRFSPGARNFFWAFWSWNSSSSKLYRSVDSDTRSILKYIYIYIYIYRRRQSRQSPSLPAFRSVPEKTKLLSPPVGSSSTRNINFQPWIDILRFRDHWSSDYLQCLLF